MSKRLLSVLVSVLLVLGAAVPAAAAGATAEDISTPPATLTAKYSSVTKSVRVDLVPTRDINITIARNTPEPGYITVADYVHAFCYAERAYTDIGLDSYYANFESNLAAYQSNKDAIVSEIGNIGYNSLISENPYAQVSFSGAVSRDDYSLQSYIASQCGGNSASATADINHLINDFLYDADNNYFNDYNTMPDKQDFLNSCGEKAYITLSCSGEDIVSLSAHNLDSLYNVDENKPCCNILESMLTAAHNEDTEVIVTLTAGTHYAFSVDLTDEQLADASSITATLDTYELAQDGTPAKNTVTAEAEEQYVGISGIEDGEWVDSEDPVIFTAEGIEHFLSLNPCTASSSIVPVRWYIDGDAENAVEFEDGNYTADLNDYWIGRIPGGEHTLTVEYNHKYVDFSSGVTSYDQIVQDDTITDSVTITFTANTFNFGEVSAILLTVFGMIVDISMLLFSSFGGIFS